MSSTTPVPGFNGTAIHAGQPGNAELVDTTKDNDSELLSSEPSNHSLFFPSTETTDTAPWIDVGEGVEPLPLQFRGEEREQFRQGGHRLGHMDWGVVNQLYGPRVRYPVGEAPARWGCSEVDAAETEAWVPD